MALGDLAPRLDPTVSGPAVLIPYAVFVGVACLASMFSSVRGLRRLVSATAA